MDSGKAYKMMGSKMDLAFEFYTGEASSLAFNWFNAVSFQLLGAFHMSVFIIDRYHQR